MNTRLSLLAISLIAVLGLSLPALASSQATTENNAEAESNLRHTPVVEELSKPVYWFKKKASDATLYTRLHAKLVEDSALNNSSIKLGVQNRVVTLSGAVNDLTQLQHAISLVQADRDVAKVKTDVTVVNSKKPGNDLADRTVERADNGGTSALILAKLVADPALDGTKIKVQTLNDAVILEGTVNSWSQYQKATELAGANGVAKVVNRLEIRR